MKDYGKLRDLGDLLMELQGAREEGYLTGLKYLDTARGIGPIVEKLPYGLQEKWLTVGSRFKEENNGYFPPFDYFADFICHEARRRNDPSFILLSSNNSSLKSDKAPPRNYGSKIAVQKTDVSSGKDPPADSPEKKADEPERNCPIHNKPHALRKCRAFRGKTLEERKSILKERGVCFRCCMTTSHLAKDCKVAVKCTECASERHQAAMHPGPPPPQVSKGPPPLPDNGGEEEERAVDSEVVSSSCTQVCGPGRTARSCSKICLVRVYPQGQREKAVNMYVILDDQSNRSLVRSDFFELFNIQGQSFPYSLKTCAGLVETSGRKAEGFQVESLDGQTSLPLPLLIECNGILNDRSEIPTPDAARHHPHLRSVAAHIPELDPNAEILILLGRDMVRIHKVRQQVSGPPNAPFAQKLDLGWVLVGDVCLGKAHKPVVGTFKTSVLEDGRPSLLTSCKGFIKLTQTVSHGGEQKSKSANPLESLGQKVFNETDYDNKPAPSIEDMIFLEIMDREVYRDESNNWVAPLPFRVPRQRLSNNREQVFTHFTSLEKTLQRKSEMKDQFLEFMKKIFDNRHAEGRK